MTILTTRVLIIGAGVTGAGLLRDLALRGVQALLIEQRDVNSGASGGNHGLLHSGARYVASDREAAVECLEEGQILRRIAPQCIEDTGGLFVAVRGDDERYIADFPSLCAASGIPCRGLDPGPASWNRPCRRTSSRPTRYRTGRWTRSCSPWTTSPRALAWALPCAAIWPPFPWKCPAVASPASAAATSPRALRCSLRPNS